MSLPITDANGVLATISPPSFSSHEPLPLANLLTNFSRKSQDEFFEFLEGLESRAGLDEHTRRKKLFMYFTNKQRQFGQVFALVRWLGENHVFLDRLRDLISVVDRRAGLLDHTCESMQILQRRVEDRLYPLWDVFTALHVMSTGTYRLLPGIIETRLLEEHQLALSTTAAAQAATGHNPLKPPITEEMITTTIARLNNALHIKLLSTQLPVDLTHIDIRDGIAYLTYGQEFEIGVSLRMGPAPTEAPYPNANENEESRIHWRLYDLKVLMNVDQQSALTTDLHHTGSHNIIPLFNESQILHLNVLLNTVATGHPNPITSMCDTMHHLLLGVLMDILHQQSISLTKLFAMQDIQVEYVQASKLLNIKYWRDMKEMPIEGGVQPANRSPPTKKDSILLTPCLQILFDQSHDRLSIRHHPPLPPSTEFPSLFSLNLQSISLTHLLTNVLQFHGNHRIEQLFGWILRETKEKGRKVIGMMEMEVTQRGPKQTMKTDSAMDQIQSKLESTHISTPSSSTHVVVPRSYLIIRLLPGYTISIHTDIQSGRFVMEWCHHEDEDTGAIESNLVAFSAAGSTSPLTRILYAETLKLNTHIGSIFEILVHLRMVCLTQQLAKTAAALFSNQRLSIFTMLPPFCAAPMPGLATAPAIQQRLKHVVFDPVHYKQYNPLGDLNQNELFARPGLGPYTVFLQPAGYSTHYYIVLQLNPFTQLAPTRSLIQTAQMDKTPTTAGGHPVKLPFYIRQLVELHSPITPGPTDPSVGFTSQIYPGFADMLDEAERVIPLLMIRRDLQSHFTFISKEVRVINEQIATPDIKLPQPLEHVLQERHELANREQLTRKREKPISPAYLLMTLNFPLNYSLHNPAHLKLDRPSDPNNTPMKQDAYAIIFPTPPSQPTDKYDQKYVFNLINRPVPPTTPTTTNPLTPPSSFNSSGFIVYFYHPLIAEVLTAFRNSDLNASKASIWEQLSPTLHHQVFGNHLHLPQLIAEGNKKSAANTGLITFVYDSITTARVARLIYEIDNLYVHMCLLSNFVKEITDNILGALVSGLSDVGHGGQMDDFIENDGTNGNGTNVIISEHTKSTSLNPTYFPTDFYRCVEFNCNHIVFAYVNPNLNDINHPLCFIRITRDHRRSVWKLKDITQPHMYPLTGGPPKTPLPQDATQFDWQITLQPISWPQTQFYNIDFQQSRSNKLLTILHHVWVAHRTMTPIWNFIQDTQHWHSMAYLTNNHQFLRLYSVVGGSMVHIIPSSSTRIRLLFGQRDRAKIQENMWRCKTDLRFIYEGEVVHDLKAGLAVRAPPTVTLSQDSMDGAPNSQTSNMTVVRPGKIPGDVTQFLYRWYKQVATDEFKQVLRALEKATPRDSLFSGARFEFQTAETTTANLSTPFLQLQFTPPASGSTDNQLSPAEQYSVSTYFAHRLALPPYLSEPLYTFHKLFQSPAANNVLFTNATFHTLRLLIESWSLELLQPYPFPQPFSTQLDVDSLKQTLAPDLFPSPPLPLAFRFQFLHRATFGLMFVPESMIISCTIEVMETKYLQPFASFTGDHINGDSHELTGRPYSLSIPLAYHMDNGSLFTWSVPSRPANGQTRKYHPIPPQAGLPPTFRSLAQAIHTLLSTCTMDQLAEWMSAPQYTPPVTATITPTTAVSNLTASGESTGDLTSLPSLQDNSTPPSHKRDASASFFPSLPTQQPNFLA